MISRKNDNEIKIMKEGGAKLSAVFNEVEKMLQPNITTADIEAVVCTTIEKLGGTPSFKKVGDYKHATCICVNEQVVHTPPSDTIIHDGDIVTVDSGVLFKGLNTDKAITYIVGKPKDNSHVAFLNAGKRALQKALQKAIDGNHVGDISQAIQHEIERSGYYIIRELTGHGIGTLLHEDPAIPGFLEGSVTHTPPLLQGMTIAIEVIYSWGKTGIINEKGGHWSLITKDKSISACFEHTILVQKGAPLILA